MEKGNRVNKLYNLKWVIFIRKTVYIGIGVISGKTTHLLLVKIAKNLIYDKEKLKEITCNLDPFKQNFLSELFINIITFNLKN